MRDYGRDPEAFAKDLLGIQLQSHQADAMGAPGPTKTILKGRQSGGSVTILVRALHQAFRQPGHLVLIISASDRQSVELGERMQEVVIAAPIARSLTRCTSERLTFSNGSEVYLLPSNPRTIRGFGSRGLVLKRRQSRPGCSVFVDEAAHHQAGDAIRKAAGYALATAPEAFREMWIITTPTTSDNWVMKYFDFGVRGEPGFWSARWPSELNAVVDRAWLAQVRRTALPAEVACEIDGRPADDAEAFLARLLPQCIDPRLPWPVPPRPGGTCGVGIDLALPYSTGRDSSAAVLLGRRGTPQGERWTVLDLWKKRTYVEAELLAVLAGWQHRYYVTRFVVEQYGSTGVMEGATRLRLPIEVVAPVPGNQAESFTRVYQLAKERRLTIPATATPLIEELKILRHAISETGTPRFSAPGSRHDDTCFALAWAVRALGGLSAWALGAAADSPILSCESDTRAAYLHGLNPSRGPVITTSDENSIQRWKDTVNGPGGSGTSSAPHGRRGLIL